MSFKSGGQTWPFMSPLYPPMAGCISQNGSLTTFNADGVHDAAYGECLQGANTNSIHAILGYYLFSQCLSDLQLNSHCIVASIFRQASSNILFDIEEQEGSSRCSAGCREE